MSGFTAIRPYFRTQLDALGFKEWKDGFNVENIPSNLINKAYHIETPGGSRRDPYSPLDQGIEQDVTVRVFLKGYRDPASAIDDAMLQIDRVLTRCLASERRLGAEIKNIYYNGNNVEQLNSTNDNVVLLEINFICFIILCV